MRRFAHYDASAAYELIERDRRSGFRPVIVADGFCPSCGCGAPIAEFLQCLKRHGGKLVLDDTQALGVLGERSDAAAPFGHGGGASLRWRSVTSSDVIVGASLAKGFGVPVAVVCGTDPVIGRFEEQSETRVHSSPASLATLHAAEHALAMNRRYGDRWRHHLWQLVERFCAKLQRIGLRAQGGLFPVQSLNPVDGVPAEHSFAPASSRHPDRSGSLLPWTASTLGFSYYCVAPTGRNRSRHRCTRVRHRLRPRGRTQQRGSHDQGIPERARRL